MNEWHELAAICRTCDCSVQYDEPLRNHTTFRIGGNCAVFVNINAVQTLQQVLKLCRERQYPYAVLGNGSNVLAADTGFPGVILHLGNNFSKVKVDGTKLHCQSGATLGRIGKIALEESLSGMECLAGIPGTVGGALYMNAGAYGVEIADIIVSATCVRSDGTVYEIARKDMELGYRKSIFLGNDDVIAEVTLELRNGKYAEIKAEMNTLLGRRRAKQPLELPSAGSTFKRPMGNYASFLIDQCGLKGASVGDAQVSRKHAGFVVNTGKATCRDVLELCNYVKQTVYEKTGYALELEPVILGKP